MKNATLYTLKEVIGKVKDLGDNRFKKPLIYIEIEVDKELEVLKTLRKPSEGYEAFLEEQKSLLSKHAETDEGGNLVLYSGADGEGERVYDYGYPKIIKDEKGFKKGASELEAKHKETLELERKKELDFQKTLQDDCIAQFNPIPFDVVPEMPYDYMKLFFETGVIEKD